MAPTATVRYDAPVDTASSTADRRRVDTQERLRAVKIAAVASLSVCVVELALGGLLHLQSLVAEGIHTLLDALDSLIVLFAVYKAVKPADRSHQFGHGKFEALGASVEASFIFAAAIGIAWQAVDRLIDGRTPGHIPAYVCAVMGVTAIAYFALSRYLMQVATRTRSPAVLAEALHLRSHIYITGGLAAGLLIGYLRDWPVADTVLALAVAGVLVLISIRIFREVFKQFIDAALPEAEIQLLGGIVAGFSRRFVEVHGLRTRQSGVERHIEMHLVISPETSVADAHDLSHEIEAAIEEQWPDARTTVHIEPGRSQDNGSTPPPGSPPKVRIDDASPDEREFLH